MQPFYFSTPEGDVFAVYHQPRAGLARRSAVLMCYPLGHEYINSHRAYRQIGTLLSEAGFPVLRFDYLGSGDSGGTSKQASVRLWLSNLSRAVAELEAKSGGIRLCFIGLRLGATLALLGAARTGPVESLVLWDPIVEGKGYLRELESFHKRALDTVESSSRGVTRPPAYDGLSLFGFGDHFRHELGVIDLLSIQQKPAERVLLLQSGAASDVSPLTQHLQQRGATVEHKHIPVDESWRTGFDSLMLPGQAVPPTPTSRSVALRRRSF
jgi:pimeloyl-ACP methyl ester carboxylesterase